MYHRRFETELGTHMVRVDKKKARFLYAHCNTLLIAAENPGALIPHARYARLQGDKEARNKPGYYTTMNERELLFDKLVETFEKSMCGDTQRYAFFYAPTQYIRCAGMWDLRTGWDDIRYMAGFKEWTLDGLKEVDV